MKNVFVKKRSDGLPSPLVDFSGAVGYDKVLDMPDVRNPEEMREFLKSIHMTVTHFRSLPVYRNSLREFPWLLDL